MAFYIRPIDEIQKFDGDYETSRQKAYVSLKFKKQFMWPNPSLKTGYDIGFNLKA